MLIKALQTALSDGMLLETEERLVSFLLQLDADDFCLSSVSKSHHDKPYMCVTARSHSLAVSKHFARYRSTSAADGSFPRGLPHAPPRSSSLKALPARERAGLNFEVDSEEDLGLRFLSRRGQRSVQAPLLWAVASRCGHGGRQRWGAASSSSPRRRLLHRPEDAQSGRDRAGQRLLPCGKTVRPALPTRH